MASKLEKTQILLKSVDALNTQASDVCSHNSEQIIAALAEAKSRISPLWDVRDYVAVNPLFGYRDQKIQSTVHKVLSLTGTLLLPEKDFFKELYKKQDILDEDLATSFILLEKEAPSSSFDNYDHKTLLQFLESPKLEIKAEDMVLSISDLHDLENEKKRTDLISKEVSKWASAYFDEGQSVWKMPGREKRFFKAWKGLVVLDSRFDEIAPQFRAKVQTLPEDPLKAVVQMIQELQTFGTEHNIQVASYLARNLATVSGWASYIQKFEFEDSLNGNTNQQNKKGGLVDLLAIRLVYDISLLDQVQDTSKLGLASNPRQEILNEIQCRYIWLQALEASKRRQVQESLQFSDLSLQKDSRPMAQMAFCIDVRSEVIRRHLERQSDSIQTIGFAGFFGLPIAVKRFGFSGSDIQCPVLIKPSVEVHESTYDNAEAIKKRRIAAVSSRYGFKSLQSSTNSSFSVAETFGFASALKMLGTALSRIKPNINIDTLGLKKGQQKDLFLDHAPLDMITKTSMAAGALRNMGLTENFAPYVFFFGHGGESSNNPYESALDCGACAGHKGLLNSQFLASLLNDGEIRKQLQSQGISIPADTVFIPGWHNTTRDHLIVEDLKSFMENEEDFGAIQAILEKAGENCRLERAQHLPNAQDLNSKSLVKETSIRAQDWSEIRPEWALARNHSFIVARRSLTRKMDLQGRSFLHDYDFATDQDLSKLELIMTAPMIVTNWINMQYFASTIDPDKFGAGNKTMNNVVGTIGCIQGNESDLLGGLSEQSVRYKGKYFHEPVRLQVFLEAPAQAIDEIIKKHKMVSELIENGWLHVLSIDSQNKLIKLRHNGSWIDTKEGLWN